MLDALKANFQKRWEQFQEGEPGSRFEERYRRRRAAADDSFGLVRLLYIVGGVLVMLAGLVMMPAPGPGTAVFVVGLSFLGSEFLPVARFMDRSEMRLRLGFRWARRTWHRTSPLVRAGLVLLVLVCAAGLSYGMYHFAFVRWT